jgi:autotransporter passenger strand-loop-strand repeat protein
MAVPPEAVIAFSGGAIVELASGGTATGITMASGGTLAVLSGGIARPVTIASGGLDIVSARGSDFGAQVSGGTQLVYGLASGATLMTGLQVIESGGIASRTLVSSGGTLDVLSGGTAVAPQLFAGGALVLNGLLSGFVVSSGVTLPNTTSPEPTSSTPPELMVKPLAAAPRSTSRVPPL